MYRNRPNLSIGFHGCDLAVMQELVSNPDKVKKSQEKFDWLGNGFYVWENNQARALKWAVDKKQRGGQLKNPAVVGVVYQLDYCLDLTDSESIELLPAYYKLMKDDLSIMGKNIPENRNVNGDKHHDLVIRELDCAVIEYMHQKIDEEIKSDLETKGYSEYRHFDTVRGIFTEGGPIFDGAGIQSKNHIQVCIRNLNCIKGFFMPRKESKFP
jgi:hypothetical protein